MRFDPNAPLWSRAITMGALASAFFGVFDVLIIGLAVTGGRFQSCGHTGQICDFYLLSVTYPLGAAIMGAILGAANPLFQRRWLALALGAIAVTPWFALIAITDVKTRAQWTIGDTVIVAMCSLLIGPFVGYRLWKRRPVRK